MLDLNTDKLLELARLTLLEKVLNKPPAINRYPTLMAANAIAIVRRYEAQYPDVRRAQAAQYGEWAASAAVPIPRNDQGGPPDANALAAGVADAMRQGRFDHHPGIIDQFRTLLEAELSVTNPSFLEQFKDEAEETPETTTNQPPETGSEG